jgi:transposase InsO family protein
MHQHGLVGVTRRRAPTTTTRAPCAPKGPDLVQREFVADRPDALWVADITYVPTGSGFLYLAVVLDVFSRRIVGWAMAGHLRTELVLAALDMAVTQRKPEGVVHHSDHGSQPGFKRSLQHLDGGRCDEYSEAEFGEGGARGFGIARAALGGAP